MPLRFRFEDILANKFESFRRQIQVLPLNLGGIAGSGGGLGGPPGGFAGRLPQSRVTFDTDEFAISGYPSPEVSGTLVDNLNRIRYRIEVLESGGGGGGGGGSGSGIYVKHNDVLVGSGITTLDFSSQFEVTITDLEANVSISGVVGSSSVVHVFGENITSQIPASGNVYTTISGYSPSTLSLYYNGIRQGTDYYTENASAGEFTTLFSPVTGDEISVDYLIE